MGTSAYADKTGYMGFASNQIGYPRKAFVRPFSVLSFPPRDGIETHSDLVLTLTTIGRTDINIGCLVGSVIVPLL